MRRLLLALVLAGALPARAATVLGSPVCIDYHSAYADPERQVEKTAYQSWLLGYLSGLAKGSEMLAQDTGKERFPGEYNVLNDIRPEQLAQWADAYCQHNPDRKLLDASLKIFERLLDSQVDELSDGVDKVGG